MKAVIFDLDGTLVDTLEDIRAAINYARRAYDGEPVSSENVKSYVGNGLRKALMKACIVHGPYLDDENEYDLMYQLMISYYLNHPVVYSKPYEGILPLIAQLREKNFLIGIVSNKADLIVKEIVNKCFERDCFDYVSGAREGVSLKPDAKPVLNALEFLKVPRENALIIGDSEVDYRCALNARVSSIIVNYGFRGEEELSKAGISSINHVPTIKEIEQILAC